MARCPLQCAPFASGVILVLDKKLESFLSRTYEAAHHAAARYERAMHTEFLTKDSYQVVSCREIGSFRSLYQRQEAGLAAAVAAAAVVAAGIAAVAAAARVAAAVVAAAVIVVQQNDRDDQNNDPPPVVTECEDTRIARHMKSS